MNEIAIRNMLSESGKAEEMICRMVYEFASKLPYSMDYMDPDFVPGDFLNMRPENPKKRIFIDHGNLYNKLVSWSDTIVNGVKLQVCTIFQKMLMTEDTERYQLEEIDFYTYGFDKLTCMDIYNRNIFNLLVGLPKFCVLVRNAQTPEERRNVLKQVYEVIDRVASYVEYTKTTNEVITEGVEVVDTSVVQFVHGWSPKQDLEMMYHFNYLDVWNVDIRPLLQESRKQLPGGYPGLKN